MLREELSIVPVTTPPRMRVLSLRKHKSETEETQVQIQRRSVNNQPIV